MEAYVTIDETSRRIPNVITRVAHKESYITMWYYCKSCPCVYIYMCVCVCVRVRVFVRSQWPSGGFESHTRNECFEHLFCVVLWVGSGLVTGWSPVQGGLPTVFKIKINWQSDQGPKIGYKAIDEDNDLHVPYRILKVQVAYGTCSCIPQPSCMICNMTSILKWKG
jgi:hypothetical protein